MDATARSPRVLVVEDDDAIRALLVHALRHEPLIVDAAADGHQASVLARTNDYSLMLVDYMLPGMTGVDFLRQSRRAPLSSTTVVIMMTAYDDEMVRHAASDLVHGFIRKPFDIVSLVQVISAIATQAAACRPVARPRKVEPWLAC